MLTLDAEVRANYLQRLGVAAAAPTRKFLCTLQQAHLRRVPFHNLRLLADGGDDYELPSLADIARDNSRGLGGTCHLTNPSFAALLGSLGFEVGLVGGTVNHPGDHVLARVSLGGEELIVDVGNGHPYYEPFPFGGTKTLSSHGWSFDWQGDSLFRRLPDGGRKRVYTVDPTTRAWESFGGAMRSHHVQAEFGPFRSSLRAVRFTDEGMVALRDGTLTQWSGSRQWRRPVGSFGAAQRVLEEVFEFEAELVAAGLAKLEGRCPRLLCRDKTGPNILVAVATVGRVKQLHALLESVEEDSALSEVEPAALRVVMLDNQAAATRRPLAIPESLENRVEVVGAQDVDLSLERRLGLVSDETIPLSIGAARHALVRVVQGWLDRNEGDWVVWMLDDDLRLTQLELGEGGPVVRRSRALLAEVGRLWWERPEISIGLGTFCGDPPIPGFATWLGQIRDLQRSLLLLRELGPEGSWPRGDNDRSSPQYYYDHAGDRLGDDSSDHFVFEAPAGMSVAAVLGRLAEEVPKVLAGHQVFRPLVAGAQRSPSFSVQRGGNVVFFDGRSLLAAPFPTFRASDGIVSRRSDSLAALLCRDVDAVVVKMVDLPVLHGRREGDRCGGVDLSGTGTQNFAESQARGVALARSCAAGMPQQVAARLQCRRALHREGFDRVRQEVASARALLLDPVAWWSGPAYADPTTKIVGTLDALAELLPATSQPDDVSDELKTELTLFCASLKSKARAWRESWT